MPEWDYKALAFFLSLANSMGLLVTVIHTNITSRQKANSDTIRTLDEHYRNEVGELDDRLIRVEQSIKHLPTHGDIENIHRRIDEVAQEVRKLEGTLGQVNHSVQLIHTHLLGQKG